MKLTKLSAITAMALVSSVAMANDMSFAKPAAVGVEISTLGYGANVAWGVNDSVELQAGWAGLVETEHTADFNKLKDKLGDDADFDIPGVEAKINAEASNPYLGVQVRPFKNWLTIGTGVIVPKQSLSVSGVTTTTEEISIGGHKHTLEAGDSLKIEIDSRNKLAPYLTVGVRPNINSRFGLVAEVGAAYMGKYDSKVTVTPTENNSTAADIAAGFTGTRDKYDELRSDIEDELNETNIPVYPIVKLGATIRF